MERFNKIYPFTTENIGGYFSHIDFKDKTVLTLGSSSDQAFNALLLGARKVKVFDINRNTSKFSKLKRHIIINTKLSELREKVLKLKKYVPMEPYCYEFDELCIANPYMSDEDTSYLKLQQLLKNNHNLIEYEVGNIMDPNSLGNEQFDIIITSNVFDYVKLFVEENDNLDDFCYRIMNNLKNHLTDDGLLQMFYMYFYNQGVFETYISHISNCFPKNSISVYDFPHLRLDCNDAAFVYKKGIK